ncbi:hypothetical protein ACFQ6V_33685, partial [Streptomyces roseifaciens]
RVVLISASPHRFTDSERNEGTDGYLDTLITATWHMERIQQTPARPNRENTHFFGADPVMRATGACEPTPKEPGRPGDD